MTFERVYSINANSIFALVVLTVIDVDFTPAAIESRKAITN
jgi:hypothetical protein